MTISTLIDKQDTFEIVRDQIAAILVTEVASQMVLAGANAADYKLRIFSERSNPWGEFQNLTPADTSPLVNVMYDNSSFDGNAGNIMETQKTTGIYNIDCYGLGISADVPGGGQIAGDRLAALEVQRALRLVRNILMAAEYTYLQLRGVVWKRWITSANAFQPPIDGQNAQNVQGARLALQVTFSETSPQIAPTELDLLSTEVQSAANGEILAAALFDFT